MRERVLILGGAKSGKSALAQSLAEGLAQGQPGRLVYLATAQALDQEMAARVVRHQAQRGHLWATLEEPSELETALGRVDGPRAVLLVDCLTLWLSNLLANLGLEPGAIEERGRHLCALLPSLQGAVILVANEVGMGIVPDNPLARAFRDLAGGLNQRLAQVCDHVILAAAGLPLMLKGDPRLLPPLHPGSH